VKHLNLHQLMKTEHNASEFDERGYTPVNREQYPDYTPIMESELAALEILKHALEIGSGLGVNYCSMCYKDRFQSMGHRKRAARFCRDEKLYQTGTGYLSQMAVDAAGDEAACMKKGLDEDEWEIAVQEKKSVLLFSVEHLDLLMKEGYATGDVIYFEPVTTPPGVGTAAETAFQATGETTMAFTKDEKFRVTLENSTSGFLFYRLFVEKRGVESVVSELVDRYQARGDRSEEIARDVREFYGKFRGVEYVSTDPEPYE